MASPMVSLMCRHSLPKLSRISTVNIHNRCALHNKYGVHSVSGALHYARNYSGLGDARYIHLSHPHSPSLHVHVLYARICNLQYRGKHRTFTCTHYRELCQYTGAHRTSGVYMYEDASRLKNCFTGESAVLSRGFKSKPPADNVDHDADVEELIRKLKAEKASTKLSEPGEDNHGWIMRMANENGYLSWCRNAYISTVVSVTAFIQEPIIPYAKEVAILFLLMGCMNMAAGTASFLNCTVQLRKRIHMSSLGLVYHTGLAAFHLVVYLIAAIIYMGYVEEEAPVDEIYVFESEDSGPKKE